MAKKAPTKTTTKRVVHASAKVNEAVRTAEEKLSANDNMLRRVSKRLGLGLTGAGKEQADMIVTAVMASIQEAVVVKGALNLNTFAKMEAVQKAETTGTIQFGERKGEKWVKPAHVGIKVSNINGVWLERANDDADIIAIDDIESIWGNGEEEEDFEEDVETEKAPTPKKVSVKKTVAKKTPVAKK